MRPDVAVEVGEGSMGQEDTREMRLGSSHWAQGGAHGGEVVHWLPMAPAYLRSDRRESLRDLSVLGTRACLLRVIIIP